VPRITRDWERFEFVSEMKHEMSTRIQRAIEAGVFPAGTTPDAVFRILLAAVHGAATMRLCDRLAQGEDADALARDTLEAALQGLRLGLSTTTTLTSSGCLDVKTRLDSR
jgi:hypothetical protein